MLGRALAATWLGGLLLPVLVLLGPRPADAATPAVANGPVTFVGIGGLRWSDVDPAGTPALWQLTQHAAVGSLTVRAGRAGTCPLDGWLTLNSGIRSAAVRPDGPCLTTSPPSGTDRAIPGWATLLGSHPGDPAADLRGTLVGPTPDTADCALGPGAAVALATADGTLPAGWFDNATGLPEHCDLLVADAGALPSAAADRRIRLAEVDRLVAALAGRAEHGTLLVAGISDSLTASHRPAGADLTAVAVHPAGAGYPPGHRPLLRSASTEQTGLVQLTDLTPTLLRGPVPDELTGAALQLRPGPARQADLLAAGVAARTMRQVFVPFFVVFVGGQLAAWAAVLAWHHRRRDRPAAARATRALGMWFGSVAPASFAVNLLPWAHWGHPAVVLWVGTALGASVLSGLALRGPWRRHPYGPAAAVGAATVVGLVLDVATGSRNQIDALFGLSPLIAGRFYGFGNITFAVFAVCALIAAAAGGTWALRRGRWPAVAVVAAIGAGAALVDGWPGLGTDFGGFVSLLPGVAVLALGVAGIRVRPRVGALIAAVTVIAVSGIALLDWRRPANRRTHLGRFVQQVLDGDGPEVLARKATANVGLLHAPGTVALFVPLVVLTLLAVRVPNLLRLAGLARVTAADPVFRSLLAASLLTALLGFALNDSGVIVPAVALITGVPLFATVWAARWRELD